MEFSIKHPDFEGQSLAVKPAGIFDWGPHFFYNGKLLKRAKGFYPVKNNSGSDVQIKLKGYFLDPIPKVVIGKDTIELARPLKWYEYAWMGLPIILVTQGGAIGGGIGALAAFTSGKIFRSERSNWSKYAVTALISIGAVIAYFILAILIRILFFSGNNPTQ